MIWAKEETLPREEIEKIQLDKLKTTVSYIYDRVKPYRDKMDAAGVKPEDIQTLEDLKKLPFTYKADFRDHYPDGLFAVDKKEIVRYHASSGTTGKPTVVGYTRNDLDIWLNNVARLACMGGATADDVAQISFGYGTFTGALGLHGGLEKIGAAVIPMSSGNTNKQIMFLQDMGVTLLVATPSYALHLGEELRHRGIDPSKDLKIHIGLFGGEGMTEPMRDEMHKVWGDQFVCTQNYGMSELCGPGVAGECTELCGMHINEDWFIPEVIDPETEEVLPPGELGELVVTCLGKEALPLVRYRTGDLTRLMYEPCKCGRTTVRMENLSGRADDMLVIRGVNVFPTQIESVILEMEEFEPHYLLIVGRENNTDTMELQVEVRPEFYSDEINKMLALKKKLGGRLQSVLGLGVNVKLVEPRSIERSVGKAKRVIDNRKM